MQTQCPNQWHEAAVEGCENQATRSPAKPVSPKRGHRPWHPATRRGWGGGERHSWQRHREGPRQVPRPPTRTHGCWRQPQRERGQDEPNLGIHRRTPPTWHLEGVAQPRSTLRLPGCQTGGKMVKAKKPGRDDAREARSPAAPAPGPAPQRCRPRVYLSSLWPSVHRRRRTCQICPWAMRSWGCPSRLL